AVDAEARRGAHQPGGRIGHVGRRTGPAQPGVLHHVLGLGEAAQHAVGEPVEPGPLFLEGVGQDGVHGQRAYAARARWATGWAPPATTTFEQALPWPSAYLSVGYSREAVSVSAIATSACCPQRRTISSRKGSQASMSRARLARAKRKASAAVSPMAASSP